MSVLEAPLAIRLPRGHKANYHDWLKKVAKDRGISVNAVIVGMIDDARQKALLEEASSAEKIAP